MDVAGSGQRAYIGSFTEAGGDGITTAAVDLATGALAPLHATERLLPNPSYLATSPDGRFLYAVSETDDGSAAAFSLGPGPGPDSDPQSGPDSGRVGPEPLGEPVPVGRAPTHLALYAGHLLTANYASGSVTSLPVGSDGTLGDTTAASAAVVQHVGSGPDADRQLAPHAHAVVADPTGHWALSVDLGTDSVRVCEPGSPGGRLTVRDEVALRAGSGPRHLAFHPRGEYAYIINELDPTITVCRWNAAEGALTPLHETRLLPEEASDFPSEVVVSPNGRFAWAAVRGHDSIAVLGIEASGAELTLVTTVPCGGHWPRDLALHPDGRHLYVANERSGDVTWFAIDPRTGSPAQMGSLATPAPSCVVFV